jgi:hypothetical protein
MERKPIRTRLQNRVIKGSAIAPNTITAEEVDFGTAVVTSDTPADVVDNPKDGLLIVDPTTNSASVYSETQGDYVDVTDPTAQAAALASLQPSANTIVNASNQITAVNTNGITVYSGSSSTTGARIVMNSAGLAGFNSSSTGAGNGATFSISASTGDAIFSGTVNATGGNFTGYVTAGNMRIGSNVNSTYEGIYINASNYWYDTGDFQLGSGTSGVAFNSSTGALTIGATATIAGSAASTVVSNAAEGATALQEGNGVAKNGSDQITTISTASGIKIGTDPTGSGARIEMNSTGFYAYNGISATPTVQILGADGSAIFTGEVKAGTFSGNITSTATIAGGTITSTGTVGSYGSNTLTISGGKLAANSVIYLESAGWIDLTAISGLSIDADTEITGSIELSGDTLFNGFTNQINVDTDVGGSSTKNIRNVWIRSTLVATNASIPNSQIGDIWLQYA